MTDHSYNTLDISDLDLVSIEREARAMRARVLADLLSSLRRSVVSGVSRLFHRRAATHTA